MAIKLSVESSIQKMGICMGKCVVQRASNRSHRKLQFKYTHFPIPVLLPVLDEFGNCYTMRVPNCNRCLELATTLLCPSCFTPVAIAALTHGYCSVKAKQEFLSSITHTYGISLKETKTETVIQRVGEKNAHSINPFLLLYARFLLPPVMLLPDPKWTIKMSLKQPINTRADCCSHCI